MGALLFLQFWEVSGWSPLEGWATLDDREKVSGAFWFREIQPSLLQTPVDIPPVWFLLLPEAWPVFCRVYPFLQRCAAVWSSGIDESDIVRSFWEKVAGYLSWLRVWLVTPESRCLTMKKISQTPTSLSFLSRPLLAKCYSVCSPCTGMQVMYQLTAGQSSGSVGYFLSPRVDFW